MNKTQIKALIKKAANRKKGIGAIPVGLKFTIAGVKMYVEAQFDIYNKVHINIVDQNSKRNIVRIDGLVANKKRQALSLLMYVRANSTADLPESIQVSRSFFKTSRVNTFKQIEKDVTTIVGQLSDEVSSYNKSGSSTKKTVKPAARKTATTRSKTTAKRTAAKPKAKTSAKRSTSSNTSSTGVLKYSKSLGNGKYEYKYVKKKK